MNGAADLGGMMGFGPVNPEADEPVFHANWEKQALALTLAAGAPGGWNIDQSRHARESLPPAQYLSSSYYEIWIAGLEKLLIDHGLVSAEEVAAGHMIGTPRPADRILAAADAVATMGRGGPANREPVGAPQFAVGENIVTINMHPTGHTRLPRYARGQSGRIARVHGFHVFPDASATGDGEDPHWLYNVEFKASDLWGKSADPSQVVMIDLWEPYLEHA